MELVGIEPTGPSFTDLPDNLLAPAYCLAADVTLFPGIITSAVFLSALTVSASPWRYRFNFIKGIAAHSEKSPGREAIAGECAAKVRFPDRAFHTQATMRLTASIFPERITDSIGSEIFTMRAFCTVVECQIWRY